MENRNKNSHEQWIRLEQQNIPEGQFIVTNIIQNEQGTKITLDDQRNAVEVFFDGIPSLTRIATANSRMQTWSEVQLQYQDKLFFRNHFLFQVEKSNLVQWAVEESCGFYDEKQLTHYCIVTSEELIDVIASFYPTIKVSKL